MIWVSQQRYGIFDAGPMHVLNFSFKFRALYYFSSATSMKLSKQGHNRKGTQAISL
jgi:hypothetical protein